MLGSMGTPYRAPVNRSRRAPPCPSQLARRAAIASIYPQLVLALAFLLPAYRECGEPKSAADYAAEGAGAAGLMVPPFAVALVMAVVTLAARRLRRPPHAVAATSLAAIVSFYALGIFAAVAGDAATSGGGPVVLLAAGVAAVIGCATVALRRRGWARWGWVERAHLLMVLPFGAFFALTAIFETDHTLVGAYFYLFACVALVAVHLAWTWAIVARLRRERRRRAAT
jgi:hypothetical protein